MLTARPRLLAVALLGTAAGSRTMTPPAVLALRGRLTQSSGLRAGLVLAALGELIGDKLPATPSRTMPVAVAGRVGSGAICGACVDGGYGAVAGGIAAGAATYLTHALRANAVARTGLPDLPIALAEDALAVTLALAGAWLAASAADPS